MIVKLLITAVASLAISPEAIPKCSDKLEGVRIANNPVRPAATSGFVRTWIVVQAEASKNELIEFHIPYMTEDQDIPTLGSLCSIAYHAEILDSISNDAVSRRKIRVVDRISCVDGKI